MSSKSYDTYLSLSQLLDSLSAAEMNDYMARYAKHSSFTLIDNNSSQSPAHHHQSYHAPHDNTTQNPHATFMWNKDMFDGRDPPPKH